MKPKSREAYAFEEFMRSDVGAFARYQSRKRKRINLQVEDVEPQSKKMRAADRNKFQTVIAEQLTSQRRSAFMGDVAVKLDLATTDKNAPHAHTIAKNLLDLLGLCQSGVTFPRRHLLYKDDRQIQALFVSCRHGEVHPCIGIEARPFAALIDDLELAVDAVRDAEMSNHTSYQQDLEWEWVKTFRNLKENETTQRRQLGDALYDAYLSMTRWSAQRALLGRSRVTVPVLSWMYGRPKGAANVFDSKGWAELVDSSKIRLRVGELPIATGGSDVFKNNVSGAIAEFKKRWDWLISPLVVAVALEVIVRPNPATPAAVLHDLDNIVRDYLLPGVVPAFGTVSDNRWTIDFEELKVRDPSLAASWGTNPLPPSGTKNGVTRYEVWRLPAATGKPGFVSVALVADTDTRGDLMSEVDEAIETWRAQSRM